MKKNGFLVFGTRLSKNDFYLQLDRFLITADFSYWI